MSTNNAAPSARKVRIQLDLPKKQAAALDSLKSQWSLKSRADAVKVALGIVEWVQTEIANGGRIVAVGPERMRWLALPGQGKITNTRSQQ